MIYLTQTPFQELDGSMKVYAGPDIEAESWEEAEKYLGATFPECRVVGELVERIPCGRRRTFFERVKAFFGC